jgi:sec-independent protein translocase protein TatA
MMPNLGFMEIMVLLLVVLLVFGAKRLPEIGASMGKGIREFKNSFKETQDAVLRDDNASRSMLDPGSSSDSEAARSGEPRRLSQ